MKQRHVVGVKFTGAQLTPTIVQGLPFKTHRADDPNVEVQGYLPTTAFDALETEGNLPAVLFIDEINRSLPEAEAAILTLVNSHEIPDGTRAGGVRKFNNFLFTIAAANPPAGASEEELELGSIRKLSLALKTRFATFFQESSVHETADYLRRKLFRDSKGREAAIKAGISSQKLGNAIISANQRKAMILDVLEQAEADGRIHYTTPEAGRAAAKKEDSVFNARTLEATLEQCNGYIGDEKGSSIHGRQFSNRSFLAFYVKNCSEDQLDEIIEVLEPLKDTFVADLDNEANAFTKTWYDKFNQWMKKNQDMIN